MHWKKKNGKERLGLQEDDSKDARAARSREIVFFFIVKKYTNVG